MMVYIPESGFVAAETLRIPTFVKLYAPAALAVPTDVKRESKVGMLPDRICITKVEVDPLPESLRIKPCVGATSACHDPNKYSGVFWVSNFGVGLNGDLM